MKINALILSVFLLLSGASFAVTNQNANSVLKRITFPYAPFVFASPYTNGQNDFNLSNLITNWGGETNTNLTILKHRQIENNEIALKNLAPQDHPVIELSGYVEGEASVGRNIINKNVSDINLSGVELDTLAEISQWTTAYVVLKYDDSAPSTGYRASNSNVYVDKAFLTVGDLNKFPVYASIGQMYVPFGEYSNYMITDPITKTIGRTKERAILLGFSAFGLSASAYTMAGETFIHNPNRINNWGANLEYKLKANDNFAFNIGVSYIQNIADSEGMQETDTPYGSFGFEGFGYGHEQLQRKIPAADSYVGLTLMNHVNLIGEYLTTLRNFSKKDLSFNGKGAKVQAMNAELAYNQKILGKSSFIAVGYGKSWQALGLNVPENMITATIGASLWKYTSEKIEFRHDINYKNGNTASGGGSFSLGPIGPHVNNTITFQMDFYF